MIAQLTGNGNRRQFANRSAGGSRYGDGHAFPGGVTTGSLPQMSSPNFAGHGGAPLQSRSVSGSHSATSGKKTTAASPHAWRPMNGHRAL